MSEPLPRAVQQDDGSIVVYVQGPIVGEQPELILSVVGGIDPGDYEDTDLR